MPVDNKRSFEKLDPNRQEAEMWYQFEKLADAVAGANTGTLDTVREFMSLPASQKQAELWEILKRLTDYAVSVGGFGMGSGDVTAGSNFGADNRVVRTNGTLKGVQITGITCDDSNNLTGGRSIALVVPDVAHTYVDALTFENTTLATASQNQDTPSITWKTHGWATLPAESQTVNFRAFVRTTNGIDNPTGVLFIQSIVDGVALGNSFAFGSNGQLSLTRISSLTGGFDDLSVSGNLNLDDEVSVNVGGDNVGDIYYRNADGFFTRLPIGATGEVLKVVAGLPSWEPNDWV